MKKIEINGFKAFGEPICLDFDREEKSIVLYGENGSGKSSIFDAMLIAFYRHRLLVRFGIRMFGCILISFLIL